MPTPKEDATDPAAATWHLDKRVPLALIVTIAVQTAGVMWWMGALSERVNTIERQLQATAPNADRLTRVEVKIESIQGGIERIERFIQQSFPSRSNQ